MVGRSKPSKNMVQKSNVEFNTAENLYLKAKNVELAKALADSKNAYSQMVEERDFLQRELFTVNLRNSKLENFVKNIDSAARSCINTIVASSNHVTDILQITNSMQRLTSIGSLPQESCITRLHNSGSSSPGNSNKTHAVKPMVGGHVIFRPTINLRRVNEIPIEEIQRLQSGSGHDNSAESLSLSRNEESPSTSNAFQCRPSSSNATTFRNYQQPTHTVSETTEDDAAEEEFTDRSSETSDMASRISNGLGTVREEREDELSSNLTPDNLNSLTNTSSSSLTIPGNSSQVPLLSGVFRDVRVYLSPMQNVAQYTDPRQQNVTKERGSNRSHKSKRSPSMHSTKSSGNERSTSVENRKRTRDNLSSSAQNNLNPIGSLNTHSNCSAANTNGSSEGSCNSVLENSMLTSTKICSPNSAHSTKTNVSYMKNLSWPSGTNNFENSAQDRSTNSESGPDVANRKWMAVKERRRDSFSLKETEFSRQSYSKCVASTAEYDPLEGPSTMLDSFNESTNKLETLSSLGLIPALLQNNTSTPLSPSSPAAAVLQRRGQQQTKSNDDTPKKIKKSMHVTRRRSIDKKKAVLVSSKVAKVVVRRMSNSRLSGSPKRSSGSPQKKNSGSPQKKSSGSLQQKTAGSLQKKKRVNKTPKVKQEIKTPRSESTTEKTSTKKVSVQKVTKREAKSRTMTPQSESDSKSETPNSATNKGRPRRLVRQVSLKEPSLMKKMRRSK